MNAFDRRMMLEGARDDRLAERHPPCDPAAEPQRPPQRITLPLAPSLERRRLRSHLLMLVLDAVVILGGFIAISLLYFGTWDEAATFRLANMLLPIYWTAAAGMQVYSTRSLTQPSFAQRRAT